MVGRRVRCLGALPRYTRFHSELLLILGSTPGSARLALVCELGSRISHDNLSDELAVIAKVFEVTSHDILGLVAVACWLRLEMRSSNLLCWRKVSNKSSFCTFVSDFSSRSLPQVNIWPLQQHI